MDRKIPAHSAPHGVPASTCRRTLNVESATNDLDSAVADMREAIDALEAQLQPLMAPERPVGPGYDRSRGDSEVAERILSNADYVSQQSARIRELIDRL